MLVPTHGPNKADVPEVAGAKGEADELRGIGAGKGRTNSLQRPAALAGAAVGWPPADRADPGRTRALARPGKFWLDRRGVGDPGCLPAGRHDLVRHRVSHLARRGVHRSEE